MGLLDNWFDQWNRAARDYAMAKEAPQAVSPAAGIPSLSQAMMQLPSAAPTTGWDATVSPQTSTMPTVAQQRPMPVAQRSAPAAAMPPMPTQQSAPQSQNVFASLGQNPLFLAGLTGLGGYGPGAGAQIAQQTRQGRMEQDAWQQQQEQRQRIQEAWGRLFPNGQPAAGHPLLKNVPPEILTLAQSMGPEEGIGFLGKYAMSKMMDPLKMAELQKTQAELFNLTNPGAVSAAKKAGEMQAEASNALPGVISDAQTALDVINQTRQHPGLSAGTGWSANLPSWSPRARGFDALVKQLSGQAFLASIQKMRGMGSLSDAEGKAAREASARLETAQSQEEFTKALGDLETLVRKGLSTAYAKAGQQQPTAPSANGGWSVRALD